MPRLLLEAPKLTPAALGLLHRYCTEPNSKQYAHATRHPPPVFARLTRYASRLCRVATGVTALQTLVEDRPAARAAALDMLLQFCSSAGAVAVARPLEAASKT